MANTDQIIAATAPAHLIDHNLIDQEVESLCDGMVKYEKRTAKRRDGTVAEGLYNAWIIFNNPKQFNSYTTDMVKATILAFRRASCDRAVNAVVFTAIGDKAFCTGGNVKEYAEYYAGNPQEYRQYMRLFNDMVSAILGCDKPVICRVNGMRIGGGQEIGMACDFTIAQDLANFGQAGPKHGSAAIGGATDFLPIMIGCEQAMISGTLCEPFSAHKAARLGIIAEVVPALKIGGQFIANPTVVTDRYLDEFGRVIHGDFLTGNDFKVGRERLKNGEIDLSLLDEKVEELCAKLLETFPECMTKSLEELRKPKVQAWNANKENSRAWLALNMMNEARTGFRAFNEGSKESGRGIDFVKLRQGLAKGVPWTLELIDSLMPGQEG
ncbi:MAG: 6-oxocyclohex-1-ene-1-carbonyl-CoA hydratase [Deltaproteobacteria bacterium]|nr:6-oxocyclohex-1-ene-1-carbonyl-CoA hydratase [Deltaproteobacteria bacterium]